MSARLRDRHLATLNLELLSELLSRRWEKPVGFSLFGEEFSSGAMYYFFASDSTEFWVWFERRYDPGGKNAERLGAVRRVGSYYSPGFPSVSSLVRWLAECTGDKRFLLALLFE